MLGEAWQGSTDDLLETIGSAGYTGIEITDTMIGRYVGRSVEFGAALKSHGLTLVAYACGSPSGFTEETALSEDLAAVDQALAFTATFPGAYLSLGSATVVSEGSRDAKFITAARFYNTAGERGRRAGVPMAFHPSSHHNTLLFDRADYDRIMALTDPDLIGWVPDTGHIIRGNQNLPDTLNTYKDRIRYVHLKDVDSSGRWQMLGAGACDTGEVITIARSAPLFNGWLVLEEESDEAAHDPDTAVRRNRAALSKFGV
jgi:sugar phosphate isomerase/epimerase